MSGAHNKSSKRSKLVVEGQKLRLKGSKKIQKKNNSVSSLSTLSNNGSNSNNYSNVESLPDNFLKPGNSIVGSNDYMHREVTAARNQLGYNIFNTNIIKKYKAGNKNTKNLYEELTEIASNITRSKSPKLTLHPDLKRRRLLKTRKQK